MNIPKLISYRQGDKIQGWIILLLDFLLLNVDSNLRKLTVLSVAEAHVWPDGKQTDVRKGHDLVG